MIGSFSPLHQESVGGGWANASEVTPTMNFYKLRYCMIVYLLIPCYLVSRFSPPYRMRLALFSSSVSLLLLLCMCTICCSIIYSNIIYILLKVQWDYYVLYEILILLITNF